MDAKDLIAGLTTGGSVPVYGLTPDQLVAQQKLSQEDTQQAIGMLMSIADVAHKDQQIQLQRDQLTADTDYKSKSLALAGDELAFKKADAEVRRKLDERKLGIEQQQANTQAKLAAIQESRVTVENDKTKQETLKLKDEAALNEFKLDSLNLLRETKVQIKTKDGQPVEMDLGTVAALGLGDEVFHDKTFNKSASMQMVEELVAQGMPREVAIVYGPMQTKTMDYFQKRLNNIEAVTFKPATDEQRLSIAREAVRVGLGSMRALNPKAAEKLPSEDVLVDQWFGTAIKPDAKDKGKKSGVTVNIPKDAVREYGKE